MTNLLKHRRMKKSITINDTEASLVCSSIRGHILDLDIMIQTQKVAGESFTELSRSRRELIRTHDKFSRRYELSSYKEYPEMLDQQINMFTQSDKTIN